MSNTGEFFAIDRRVWAFVCNLGMNAAASYLVMARGTGRDNRTTSWSVNAIEKYTGLGRPRAKKAIQALTDHHVISVTRGGAKPRYHLAPPQEIPNCEGWAAPLSREQQAVASQIRLGFTTVPKTSAFNGPWGCGRPFDVAMQLARRGLVKHQGGQKFSDAASEDQSVPDWIWIPNAVVDGATGEAPPVERLRQIGNILALRIFCDLYHAQDLPSDGGLPWRRGEMIQKPYERIEVGRRGPYVIWGFRPNTTQSWSDSPLVNTRVQGKDRQLLGGGQIFWDAWNILEADGLVHFVTHLVESEGGEIFHPLPIENGEPAEQAIRDAAISASWAMVSPDQWKRATTQEKIQMTAPVLAKYQQVQLVGIARLRYRPNTMATTIWYDQADKWLEIAAKFQALAAEACPTQYATSR
ncbi:MAG: hypothetical protein KF899_04175 [Parvibaculum sp.]|nr:hypothetical protein [Parvibaculum sp.]